MREILGMLLFRRLSLEVMCIREVLYANLLVLTVGH
jgi:hypothetical protein